MQTKDAKDTRPPQADPHAAEAAFADACAFCYDQSRVFTAEETITQAAGERDRVADLLADWNKGKPPANRPYRDRRESREIARRMREPNAAPWKRS